MNSIALEAMARTLLGEYREPLVSVNDVTNQMALLLRDPEGIFVTHIRPDRTRYAQYRAWYDALASTRVSQYELTLN